MRLRQVICPCGLNALATGLPMFLVTDYEHITIGELKVGDTGHGITVTFKDEAITILALPLFL